MKAKVSFRGGNNYLATTTTVSTRGLMRVRNKGKLSSCRVTSCAPSCKGPSILKGSPCCVARQNLGLEKRHWGGMSVSSRTPGPSPLKQKMMKKQHHPRSP
ncbi:hypothetical protein TEQG_01075 [Trichophyton equinum CBS 127.97]|uniref:Uncharacterized protein n=1 Tax=Trichophyton equinum (strain ATCC MYA-4606 / CBS 127.97) TaxID=559882 RepID=F2PJG8_TRIEC|nr:hypothetical protein TEQG_01075 [Trichophyton equinum CBS 127.97]